MSFFVRIGALLPKKIAEKFKSELDFAGVNIEGKKFTGFVFSFSLGMSIAIALSISALFSLPLIESFLLIFIIFSGGIYYWLSTVAESKGSFVEKILPDALQLIASNIRAGMTTERSLFASSRPEFGPLSDELKFASKKVVSGESLDSALRDIPKKIKSKVLERTIWLLAEGIRNGGQIAELLTRLSDDLRSENSLKEEIGANVNMYIIMILVAAILGAPMLLAISTFIVEIISDQTASLNITPEQIQTIQSKSKVGGFIGVPEVSIKPEFITFFASALLVVTAVFSSLIIGIIRTGKEKAGIKYIPIMIIIDLSLFFIAKNAVSSAFGSTLGS